MNHQTLAIKKLVAVVLAKMEELNYAQTTLTNYRRFYSRIIRFAEERDDIYYSEELGSDFLKKYYHCHIDTIHEAAPNKTLGTQIRYIRVLGDFQIHGAILRRKLGPLAATSCPIQFEIGFESYCLECQDRHYSKQGNYSRMNRIKHLLFFLNEHGIKSYDSITPAYLSGYVKTFVNLKSKTVRTTLVAMRCFLRHLYLNGFIQQNLADMLPKIKNYYAPSIPRIWKPSEVKTVLGTIDRGNPTGKRDYAMLLLVARLGLRTSDLKAMRLENIRWNTNSLEITQHKTKAPVSFPLLNDIGWAIIDYLKNGRPHTNSPYVFVRHNAPFEEFAPNAAMSRILVKYIREAGVRIPKDIPLGLHSLRHTLASTLLEQNVPLSTISDILGHMNVKSTDIYLHIDFKRLQECALDPEEVFDYVR
ncbi:site-specific integrase [Desulfotomaculum sp. 1211_IL3151]|uniref:site-specific integrase n=1 Tax=Desulfotomaculum sp. 1211_IL3151 TaxID=3084055 RepID=UPI002FD8944D